MPTISPTVEVTDSPNKKGRVVRPQTETVFFLYIKPRADNFSKITTMVGGNYSNRVRHYIIISLVLEQGISTTKNNQYDALTQ